MEQNEEVQYGKRYWYPHMKPKDIAIWERFIEKFPNAYDTCIYDYHVGDPPPFNPLADNGEDLNQDRLYRLKIDVVAKKGDRVDIIEIKPNAGASSIGQVKGYTTLYIRDENYKGKIGMRVITDTLSPNLEFIAKREMVDVVVV